MFKRYLLIVFIIVISSSCGSLFEGLNQREDCTPDGLWYYYEFGNSGPYEIRISGEEGYYEKVGLGSNADKAIKAGFVTLANKALRNIKRNGSNNGNSVYDAEILTYNFDPNNGNVTSFFYDKITMEIQTLNTSLEPCNNIYLTDSDGNSFFIEKIIK
jgi:hypothetical protein